MQNKQQVNAECTASSIIRALVHRYILFMLLLYTDNFSSNAVVLNILFQINASLFHMGNIYYLIQVSSRSITKYNKVAVYIGKTLGEKEI